MVWDIIYLTEFFPLTKSNLKILYYYIFGVNNLVSSFVVGIKDAYRPGDAAGLDKSSCVFIREAAPHGV